MTAYSVSTFRHVCTCRFDSHVKIGVDGHPGIILNKNHDLTVITSFYRYWHRTLSQMPFAVIHLSYDSEMNNNNKNLDDVDDNDDVDTDDDYDD